jgi:IS30 family transposase
MQESITYRLEKDYSPEQIKGDAVNNKRPCVSIARIYQFIGRTKRKVVR